jgi:NADH-quinone oxidoreductase subunit J
MFLSFGLFYFFSTLAVLSSFFVIFTKNPVFSVLFLIFSFTNVSCILFLLNFEFLPVSFLVIYVGAIAVLFLFVLMMLNIKLAELQKSYFNFIPISVIFCFIFIVEFLFIFRTEFLFINNSTAVVLSFLSEIVDVSMKYLVFVDFFGYFSNLKTVAIAIFTDYLFSFMVISYVLLLAMVSAIVLTIQKTFVSKSQNVYSQILTNYNVSIVNYSSR